MMKNFFIVLFVCFYTNLVNCQTTIIPHQNFKPALIDFSLDQELPNGRVFTPSINSVNELKIADLSVSQFTGKENVNTYEINSIGKKRQMARVLSKLKDSINDHYGLYEGAPCVNSGPCGNFANLFYNKWNNRFDEKVSISFIMSADSSECYHVLIKLPNSDYYDGGNGILTKRDLIKGYEDGMYIIDMLKYDLELLDEKSYGLEREYPRCPNYSVEETAKIIDFHLDQIN